MKKRLIAIRFYLMEMFKMMSLGCNTVPATTNDTSGYFRASFSCNFFVILQCTALVESLFLACDGKRCFSINSREKIWGTCQEVKSATPSDLDAQSVDWDNDCQAICRSR